MKGIKIFLKKKKTRSNKKARERYENLSEEKEKKCQYCRECHENLSEHKKQGMAERRRNYYITHKR